MLRLRAVAELMGQFLGAQRSIEAAAQYKCTIQVLYAQRKSILRPAACQASGSNTLAQDYARPGAELAC